MDITQSDRDALRASQHKINPHLIGNIVEHKVQDPKKYKQLSKSSVPEQMDQMDSIESTAKKPKVHYESKYLTCNQSDSLSTVKEDLEKELPSNVMDLQNNSWLNMNQVEFDKLEWMSNKAEKIHQEKLETTTQFDKEGRAVSMATLHKQNGTREETHDIQSLFKLLDSAYHPQVTYSLTVITRIASLASMGYYDGAFDDNIHEILLKGCLLRVRHHLDNPNETICLSALKCLRSLLCNTQIDEVILDRIYPLISNDVDSNLWLHTIEMDSQEFNIEMKDSECVEVDTILGLIFRTDILKRFSYLLENKAGKFGFAYHECILDILIRMARHSSGVCYILSRKDFIPFVIKSFLPTNIVSERKQKLQLSIKALKFVRIIVQGAFELDIIHKREPSQPIIDTRIFNDIVPSLEVYFCSIDYTMLYNMPPEETDTFFKLHIETFRILKALCKLELFQAKIISIIVMAHGKLLKDLRVIGSLDPKKFLDSKISIDWQYGAHLIDLIGSVMCQERHQNVEISTDIYWSGFVRPILFNWITEVIKLKCIPHLDVSIAIAAVVYQYDKRPDIKARYNLQEVMIKPIVDDYDASKGVGLNLFMLLARTASERSQLNNFAQEFGRLRDPKGLPSYGCLNYNLSPQYNFKLSPLFDNDSPFIMLNAFIHQLPQEKESVPLNKKIFIDHLNINRYIRSVTGYHKYPTNYESMVQQSFIAQYEVQIISHSLLLLGCYYLDYGKNIETFGEISEVEPLDLTRSRIECYGNLCFYTISAIGLINMHADYLVELKDKLFDKVLLNANLQKRLARENFAKAPVGRSQALWSLDYITGIDMFKQLTADYLNVLTPVYMSFDQPNRFWIFQPLLDYYFERIKEPEKNGEQKSTKQPVMKKGEKDYWFRHNVPWRMHTGELATADDGTILSTILTFNYTMMLYSPSYLHLIIKPDIEDYLCLIGILFLDDNLFLHARINENLTNNLRNILNECIETSGKVSAIFKDASKIIKPLDLPLADFFNKLVDQFEAVSYGDIAFSNFLLLFITPGSDIVFRKKLFQEKSETCLSQIRLAPDSVWAPRELFTSTRERDPEMKELIKRSGPLIPKGSFLSYYREFHISS